MLQKLCVISWMRPPRRDCAVLRVSVAAPMHQWEHRVSLSLSTSLSSLCVCLSLSLQRRRRRRVKSSLQHALGQSSYTRGRQRRCAFTLFLFRESPRYSSHKSILSHFYQYDSHCGIITASVSIANLIYMQYLQISVISFPCSTPTVRE